MPKIKEKLPEVVYIGIDPGKSGGIVVLFGKEVIATKMPDTEGDVLHWIRTHSSDAVAVIEKVGGYVGKGKDGKDGQPGSAMFVFGMGYGGLRMALLACSIPFEEVTPQRWQKAIMKSSRGKTESKSQWKNRCKAKAQQLFPSQKVTLATADALLIALYCKRLHEGML
jgi:hypothetical protein